MSYLEFDQENWESWLEVLENQVLIEEARDQEIFDYSYVFSIVSPHRLRFHVGMLKSITLKDQQAA
jgi:hypothetical protein